jgi:hypothetical protein
MYRVYWENLLVERHAVFVNNRLYILLQLPSEILNSLIRELNIKSEFHVSVVPVCLVDVAGR